MAKRACLLSLCLLIPALAFGRGGGGQHYSGGGFSHPSGGGFSSSPGGGFGQTYYFPSGGGGAGVPLSGGTLLALLVVFAVLILWSQQQKRDTRSVQRAFEEAEGARRTQVSEEELERLLAELRGRDPGFELEGLLSKVQAIFLKLQEGWFRRDLSHVRPFLSDATYARFGVQLRQMQEQGVRNAIADIQIEGIQLIGLEQNPWFDTAHVRVHAAMRDTDVQAETSDADAQRAAEAAPLEPFTEVWSFVRKPGAKTKAGQDALSGKCPNCGAPFQGGAANNCTFCGAIVNSGHYDWVLAEITQGFEYLDAQGEVPGVGEIRARDPGLSLEVLEDRASLVFWRWIDAQSGDDPGALTKLCTARQLSELAEQARALKGRGLRKVFYECAVGAVSTRAFSESGDVDRADVEVRWSARVAFAAPGKQGRPEDFSTLPQRSIFSLVRRRGALTSTSSGMSTARCPNCNAPLTDSASPACDFCKAPLNDGGRDWVLDRVSRLEQWRAAGVDRAEPPVGAGAAGDFVPDREERERLLYMMAAMAAVDDEVDARERRLLKSCSERWGVPWANVEMALQAGPELLEQLIPAEPAEGRAFLQALVQMALVDGRVDRRERWMLEQAARRLGVREQLEELLRTPLAG